MHISSLCFMKALQTQEVMNTPTEHRRGGRECLLMAYYASASSNALASCKSVVSKPSVSQP